MPCDAQGTASILFLSLATVCALNQLSVVQLYVFLQVSTSSVQTLLLCLTYFCYIKVIRQFGCFTENISDEGNNTIDNPNIYDVDGDNRLSHCLQLLTTRGVLESRVSSVLFYIIISVAFVVSALRCNSSFDIVSHHLIF